MTFRVALSVGVAVTAALWLSAGYLLTQRVLRSRVDGAALNQRYIKAQEVLSAVRARVLLASVVVRDALLDPAPRPSDEYRAEIVAAYRGIDKALSAYVPIADEPLDRDRLVRLRNEIHAFRTASLQILETDRASWQTQGRRLLRQVLPQREAVIAVCEELQAINRNGYVARQVLADAVHDRLHNQIVLILSVAVALSLIVGWSSFRYGVRLEDRLAEQRLREAEAASDLKRLSARVVQVKEEEQRRIARELHDDIGQALTALTLELAAAEQRWHDRGAAGAVLGDARALADGVFRNVRDLSQLLHPSVLDDLGLNAALRSLLKDLGRRSGLRVAFREHAVAERLPPEYERAVYRAVQEAMTNVVRHAGATMVTVELTSTTGWLHVSVSDDGAGFDAVAAERPGRRRGLGLLGIHERVAQCGGSCRIASQPGAGTCVALSVPLPPETDRLPLALAGALQTA